MLADIIIYLVMNGFDVKFQAWKTGSFVIASFAGMIPHLFMNFSNVFIKLPGQTCTIATQAALLITKLFVLQFEMSPHDISARGTEGTLSTGVVLDLVMNGFDVGLQTWLEGKPQAALATRKLLNFALKRLHVLQQFPLFI